MNKFRCDSRIKAPFMALWCNNSTVLSERIGFGVNPNKAAILAYNL